jgi:hypothetical protein
MYPMNYYITTFCYGNKYTPILPKWIERIETMCKNSVIKIWDKLDIVLDYRSYGWWDLIRLYHNLKIVQGETVPVVHADIDLIITKDIQPLVELDYDLIFSTEHYGDGAYPPECSKVLGFGICTGFYIVKPSSLPFMIKILTLMQNRVYKHYSDQVTLMNYFVSNHPVIKEELIQIDGVTYTNRVIEIDNIRIGVLDLLLITREPKKKVNPFGNHIIIDNVGGTQNFLRYFDEDLELVNAECRP